MNSKRTRPGRSGIQPPFDISLAGLSHKAARERLKTFGFNELEGRRGRGIGSILLGILKEPMLLLLIGCGGTYLLLGEPREALVLLGFMGVIILITWVQETKTERALDALRDLSSPRALVLRDDTPIRIAGREVVPGDLLILNEGDRIPADALLLESGHLSIDESLLTGESAPVRKAIFNSKTHQSRMGGDDQPYLYAGTLIVAGKGLARVTATGRTSELGKIGASLDSIVPTQSSIQQETRRFVRGLALVGGLLCLGVVLVLGLILESWLEGILSGLTLAMAILPEEFPIVLTLFLALGAFRLSKVHVLTRRNQAIETLGAVTVLCTDKTGTLTENRMQLRGLCPANQSLLESTFDQGIPASHHALLETAILASQKDPIDPMERELREMARRFAKDRLHEDWQLEREYPLSKDLMAMSCVWRSAEGHHLMVAAKGAPEAIMDLCHLSDQASRQIRKDIDRMAKRRLRILGVARAQCQSLPAIQHDFEFEFVGLIGFLDPARASVPEAIRSCASAGIHVVMITGDYPETAKSISRAIGLGEGKILTGLELDGLSDLALERILPEVRVFARVRPEQKLRIIQAYQHQGHVVGMTGDGVNDAPALKAAEIGIAMGKRGTDVAREASDMVLIDDAFEAIVAGIRMGRRIFDNLRKAMAYLIAVHIPIAGISTLPIVLESFTQKNWPIILMPLHIVFMEMIIDPACSVVFEVEPEDEGIMGRPPRSPHEHLLSPRMIALSIGQGAVAFLMVAGIYSYAIARGFSDDTIRGITFAALVLGNLCLLLSNRSWNKTLISSLGAQNAAFWWVIAGTLTTLALSLFEPTLRQLFHIQPPSWPDLGVAMGCALGSVLWFELYKGWLHPGSHGEAQGKTRKALQVQAIRPRQKSRKQARGSKAKGPND